MTYDNWKARNLEDEREEDEMHPLKIPMRHCFNCGEELGESRDHDPLDTCGARECQSAANDARAQQREDAHERVDRDFDF